MKQAFQNDASYQSRKRAINQTLNEAIQWRETRINQLRKFRIDAPDEIRRLEIEIKHATAKAVAAYRDLERGI